MMPKLRERIVHNYECVAATDDQMRNFGAIRYMAKSMSLELVDRCPESRELNLALRKLEEAAMWAAAAISRNE